VVCHPLRFQVSGEVVAFRREVIIAVRDPDPAMLMDEGNRPFFDRLRQMGAKRYPIGDYPLTPED